LNSVKSLYEWDSRQAHILIERFLPHFKNPKQQALLYLSLAFYYYDCQEKDLAQAMVKQFEYLMKQ
jgi:hypothetical protein